MFEYCKSTVELSNCNFWRLDWITQHWSVWVSEFRTSLVIGPKIYISQDRKVILLTSERSWILSANPAQIILSFNKLSF